MRVILDDEETPGLSGERTDLAWSRSGIAVLTCAAAIVRRIASRVDSVSVGFVVFGLFALGAIAWMAVMGHARKIARSTIEGRQLPDRRALRTAAFGTFALAAASLVLCV